jgi:hypothetical protein
MGFNLDLCRLSRAGIRAHLADQLAPSDRSCNDSFVIFTVLLSWSAAGKWGTNNGRCPPSSILARRMRRVAGLHEVEGLLVH